MVSNQIVSHAQQFEDIILWRAFKAVDHGVYLDVGASDPVNDSVSLLFYEQGWRGVHVEASPRLADLLRRARPDEMVIEAVAGNAQQRLVPFYECVDPAAFGLGTMDLPHLQTIQAHGFQTQEYTVPVITLDEVFQRIKATEIHWLKIDVEGSEKQVLEGWQGDCRPWVVLLECVSVLSHDENYQDWEELLLAKDYVFAWTDQLNRYYVHVSHKDLVTSFQVGLSVFDDFQVSADSHFFVSASTVFHQKMKSLQKERDEARLEYSLLITQRDEAITQCTEAHAECDAVTVQRDEAIAQCNKMHVECSAVIAQRDEAIAQCDKMRVECSAITAQLDEIWAHREEVIAQLGAVTTQRNEAIAQCDAFRSSKSWRITRPLRFIGRMVRGIKSQCKALFKSPLLVLIRLVRRYRLINELALFCLRCTPRLKERLRVLEHANKAPVSFVVNQADIQKYNHETDYLESTLNAEAVKWPMGERIHG